MQSARGVPSLKFRKPGWANTSSETQGYHELNEERSSEKSVVYNEYADLSLANQRRRLPIFNYRNHILYLLEKHNVLIIVGETGSGKSTQIPQYLVEAGWTEPGKQGVLITQPRRIAAVTLAKRVAEEQGVILGNEVGYAIRFDECSSKESTVIKYVTDGVLLREMMSDPLLKAYNVVLVDEAHERSINTDMCLGLLRKIQNKRKDLRIIISSATISAETFKDFFSRKSDPGTVGILSVEGRTHDIEVMYLRNPVANYIKATVEACLQIHYSDYDGDILAFLTGQDEVKEAVSLLIEHLKVQQAKGNKKFLKVLPFYSTLSAAEQLKVFERVPKRGRKAIIATNIAETSVTIDGIAFVVDCGFVKLKVYNPKTAVESLVICPASKASLEQRAGRAGRSR